MADDEDRILAIDGIAQQHQAAADREDPERGRHHAAPGPLGGDPLHDEAHGEQNLRDVADQQTPIHVAEKDVVQVAAEGAREIDQHVI